MTKFATPVVLATFRRNAGTWSNGTTQWVTSDRIISRHESWEAAKAAAAAFWSSPECDLLFVALPKNATDRLIEMRRRDEAGDWPTGHMIAVYADTIEPDGSHRNPSIDLVVCDK